MYKITCESPNIPRRENTAYGSQQNKKTEMSETTINRTLFCFFIAFFRISSNSMNLLACKGSGERGEGIDVYSD